MFKKFVCMTALSFAIASSQDVYSDENYTLSDSVSISVSDKSIFNNTNCTTNTINSTASHNSTAHYKYLTALNIIVPVFDTYIPVRPVVSKYCDTYENPNNSFCKLVKYIKYKTGDSTRNKIMTNIFERIIYSTPVAICISLCSIFSLMENWTGTTLALVPVTLISLYIIVKDLYYAIQYKCSTEQQLYNNLEEDIAYLHALYDQNHTIQDFIFCITESDKKSERKRVFESVIQRGLYIDSRLKISAQHKL